MIQDKLSYLIEKNKTENKLLLRTILKEGVQDYILNFVYNDQVYKQLIFTGGTCLRKIYGLHRLSEDLDFDFLKDFQIKNFAQSLNKYFVRSLQYKKIEMKISGNQKTVFIQFPTILKEIGLVKSESESQQLFVRCDFFQEKIGNFQTEVSSISTTEFTFFVLSYDLPTLFSNKIIAFLNREFFKGKKQSISFKGRDVFDLVWFFEQAERTGLEANWQRLYAVLKLKTKRQVVELLIRKLKQIDKKGVVKDLEPFIESQQAIKSFSENFFQVISARAEKMIV